MLDKLWEFFVEVLKLVVEGIMDALEEFFSALVAPSTKFTFNAFLVSLVFLGLSIVSEIIGVFSFVSWQEALTCSIILSGIVLIDSTARKSIKENLDRVRNISSILQNKRNKIEMEEEEYEPRE